MDQKIENLFRRTAEAFEKSEIKKKASKNESWNYSLMATRINPGMPLIIGFNFAADGENHKAQKTIPPENFRQAMEKKWLGSFSRVYGPLKEYLPDEDVDNFMMTNFCFFRSKAEAEISRYDLDLCAPLFEDLVNIIKPSMIIGFSAKLRNYFKKMGNELENETITSDKKSLIVSIGNIIAQGNTIPTYILPHPNSPLDGNLRKKAWAHCFSKNDVGIL